MPLLDYIATLKDVRMILLLDPRQKVPPGTLEFLIRRSQYHNIGVSSNLYDNDKQYRRKNFARLTYPHGSVSRFFAELSPDVPEYIREAVLLSSCYAAPLAIPNNNPDENFINGTVWERRSRQGVGQGEVLNLLASGAQALTELFPFADEAYRGLTEFLEGDCDQEALEKIIDDRKIVAQKDGDQRFKAIEPDSSGKAIITYIDPLRLLLPWLFQAKPQAIKDLPLDNFGVLSMGIVCAIHINLERTGQERTARPRRPVGRRRDRRRRPRGRPEQKGPRTDTTVS